MLSYVLPTRNRPERLRKTLDALGNLDAEAHNRIGGGEVIVIDNASSPPVSSLRLSGVLANGLPLRAVGLEDNHGAAARNIGVENSHGGAGGWIIMLDDDSHPLSSDHIDVLLEADDDIAAIGAEILLRDGSHERGGLPEVFVGCGVAIRRNAFLDVGGYDPSFDYYAEEYDLCAKLLLAGWRIQHDWGGRFRVLHEKVASGRDFNAIIHRLVRNNAWVMQRYAPDLVHEDEIAHIIERYAGIAVKEKAASGFAHGMSDLADTLTRQPRTPLSEELWDRFTGAAYVRETLRGQRIAAGSRIALIDRGKNENVIRRVLEEFDVQTVDDQCEADVLMIGTLSPGPMLDAWERARGNRDRLVIMPWTPNSARARHLSGAAAVEQASVPAP